MRHPAVAVIALGLVFGSLIHAEAQPLPVAVPPPVTLPVDAWPN